MRMRRKGQRPEDLVSAQELACWAFCPEQWRLQYGLGLPAANQVSLREGDRHHAEKARSERVAGGLIVLGRWLVLVALIGLLLLLALNW